MAAYITISHLDEFGMARFMNPGLRFILRKEPNAYDDESISVYSEKGIKSGCVANSSCSVVRGTHSAGYIYRDFEQETSCTIRFRTDAFAIAELNEETAGNKAEKPEERN